MKPRLMFAKLIDIEDLKDWDQRKWENHLVEPKIDGVRFVRIGGKWVSRNGKPYHNLEHITKVIDAIPDIDAYIVDGELVGDDWSHTVSYARSFRKTVKGDVRYIIFDLIPIGHLTQSDLVDRKEEMPEFFRHALQQSRNIILVPTCQVSSFYEFQIIYNEHLADGCDGAILKDRFSQYEFRRNKAWLKVKPIMELDCKIVGFNEGKGKYKGTLGSIEVKIPVNKGGCSMRTTSVSGMSDKDRDFIWKHQKKLLNKLVEVKFRKISEKNRLIEPRLLRLRLDKEVD